MRFQILLIFLLSLLARWGTAQEHYSYISDRKFKDPTDLIGYDFKPAILEIKDESEQELSPGEYSFGVTQANLYVVGEGIKGVYSINNINSTDYGYKLSTMNARDPTIQGHLKIVLNNRAQVDAIIFKRSTKEQEMIFYQAQMSEDHRAEEDTYFTGRWEMEIEEKDSIWGKRIMPFIRVHTAQNVQQRLQPSDSTSITLIKTVKLTEKKKKKKKGEEEVEDEPLTIKAALAMDEEELKERKIKVSERYVVKVRSIVTYDDGTVEDKVDEYDVKKITEREDVKAAPDGERFRIDLELEKGGTVFLYLTQKRTVSSFETPEHLYLMKGY